MAKDKVDISIPANKDSIKKSLASWKSIRPNKGSNYDMIHWIDRNGYFVKYMHSDEFSDRLMISCNISNILAANSEESKIEFNEDMLRYYIHRDLGDIIDFTNIVDITEWIISRDETYIDILVPDHMVEELFRVCMKTTVRRKRSDTT